MKDLVTRNISKSKNIVEKNIQCLVFSFTVQTFALSPLGCIPVHRNQYSGSVTLERIRILGFVPLTYGTGPFYACSFSKVHLHNSSEMGR
jgi:hypothetical protein